MRRRFVLAAAGLIAVAGGACSSAGPPFPGSTPQVTTNQGTSPHIAVINGPAEVNLTTPP